MTTNEPVQVGRIARGACRCPKCVAVARNEARSGAPANVWGPINDAVHGDDIKQALKEQAQLQYKRETEMLHTERAKAAALAAPPHGTSHAMKCLGCQKEAQRLRDLGVRWVSWSAVQAAVHRGVPYDPQPEVAPAPQPKVMEAAKKRYQLYNTGVSFTFDQAVGFAAGLTLSLPIISVFGLGPDVGVYIATGLTALGTSTPWLISKTRDTEKRKAEKPAAVKSSRKTRLASAHQDHEAVLLAWAKYETDVALQIDYPTMTDVRQPETAALAKALRAAEIASRHSGESIDSLIRYEGSVLDLEAAFKAAETAAKLDQQHPLTADQKALAHTLLAMAVDPAGNAHERRGAHQRLLKLLDGLIVLAEPARLALEASTARREVQQ
jgi:hypothetical protein